MKKNSRATDIIEITDLPHYIETLTVGAALLGADDLSTYEDRLRPFESRIECAECHTAFHYWLGKVKETGGVPSYGSGTLRDLAPIARNLLVRERDPGTTVLRYRYFGETMAARLGREMTGAPVTDLNKRTTDQVWEHARWTFEEGRPSLATINQSMVAKGFVRAVTLGLPFADGVTGQIRFSVMAVGYID